jgi:peptide/nickel transport system substrate-binding protein
MKRIALLISALVIMSMVLAACGPEEVVPTEPPEVTEAPEVVPTEPVVVAPTEYPRAETLYVSGSAWGPANDWNPFITWSKANTTGTCGFVYESLFAFNPMTGELTPWLAESGTWSSDTTYDLVLRSGMTWSDGEPITAEDVKFTFELGQTYAAIWFSPVWDYLTGITVTDETHLSFAFTDPLYQEWTNNLYNIFIVPQHVWESKTEEDITAGVNENPIGSGAYLYLTRGEDRNVWIRNENWWGIDVFGLPGPKYIVDIRFSSNNVALGAVIKGEVDLSNNFLPGIATLSDKGYVETYYPSAPYMVPGNTAVLFLNTTLKPMDDAAFRRALAFAIDVPSIVNVAYANLVAASSPTGLLPTLSQYDDQAVLAELGYSFDTAKAKQMLAAAGYVDTNSDGFVEAPDGSTIALEVTCPNGWTDWMASIDIIASSAQAAGINIVSVYPDYGAWNTALTEGTFNMTLNNWATMSNTPWTLYNLLFRHPIQATMGSGNFGRYESQEMFDLVDALAKVKADDVEGIKSACSDIQRLMLTDVPMIPLWYNGLWAQFSTSTWTNWPVDGSGSYALPITWNGYWQMGGMLTLIELQPVTPP